MSVKYLEFHVEDENCLEKFPGGMMEKNECKGKIYSFHGET